MSLDHVIRQKLDWLTERQRLTSENIAQSRQPGYLPKDIKPFKEVLRDEGNISLKKTQQRHLNPKWIEASPHAIAGYAEVSYSGNGVVLEYEVLKASEITKDFKEASALFERCLKLRRTALLRGR